MPNVPEEGKILRLAAHQLAEQAAILLRSAKELPCVNLGVDVQHQCITLYPAKLSEFRKRVMAVNQIAQSLEIPAHDEKTSTGVSVRRADKEGFIPNCDAFLTIRAINDEQPENLTSRETSSSQFLNALEYIASKIRKTPNVKNLIKSINIVDTGKSFTIAVRMEGDGVFLAGNASKLLAGIPYHSEPAQPPYGSYSALTEHGHVLVVTTYSRALQPGITD